MEYGISYYGSSLPENIKRDLDEIKSKGCTYILLAISELDYEFYWDAVRFKVEYANKIGLTVFLNLWAFGGFFGGEAYSKFLAENPETRQKLADGEFLPHACLNNKEFLLFVRKALLKCCQELDISGIFLDEPHFYFSRVDENKKACFCDSCKKSYYNLYLEEMPNNLGQRVLEFRNKSTLQFIKNLSKFVKSINKNILVNVCCMPKEKVKDALNWEEICSIKEVDIFSSDPYWSLDNKEVTEYVSTVTKQVLDITKRYNKRSEIWVQIYKIPKEKEGEIKQAVKIIKSFDIDYINAWTFRAAQNSRLSSDDPIKCWNNLSEEYLKDRDNLQ